MKFTSMKELFDHLSAGDKITYSGWEPDNYLKFNKDGNLEDENGLLCRFYIDYKGWRKYQEPVKTIKYYRRKWARGLGILNTDMTWHESKESFDRDYGAYETSDEWEEMEIEFKPKK